MSAIDPKFDGFEVVSNKIDPWKIEGFIPENKINNVLHCINLNNVNLSYRDSLPGFLERTYKSLSFDDFVAVKILNNNGKVQNAYIAKSELINSLSQAHFLPKDIKDIQNLCKQSNVSQEVLSAKLNEILTADERQSALNTKIREFLNKTPIEGNPRGSREKIKSYLLEASKLGPNAFQEACDYLSDKNNLTKLISDIAKATSVKTTPNVQQTIVNLGEYNPFFVAEQFRSTRSYDANSKEVRDFIIKSQGVFSFQSIASEFAQKIDPILLFEKLKFEEDGAATVEIPKKISTSSDVANAEENNADKMEALCLKASANPDYKMMLFTTADGSGKGKESPLAAESANRGFIKYLKNFCANTETLTAQDLVKQTVKAVESAQNEILEARIRREPVNANTTHLGFVSVIDNKNNVAHCCFSSVGDCKLLAKLPDGTLIDFTKELRPNSLSATDPGGQLGRKYRAREAAEDEIVYGEIPDLRNFVVSYLTVPVGTVFLPMSDGVYDNFDPKALGITPWQTFQELIEEEKQKLSPPSENAEWTDNLNDQRLRNAYFLQKIGGLIQQENGQNAVDTIVKTAIDNALSGKGKRDDTCCAWIQV